jgi:5-methylcytosine-specific restriction protein B
MKDIFEWITFYKELAQKLLDFKDNPSKLASVIYENFDRDKEIKFLHDGDGSDFNEIDPFTVFSIINRVMKNRVDMIKKMKEVFDISAKAPDSFEGIPTQNPINASFCCFSKDRSEDGKDIERLWNLFEKALQGDENMEECFNAVLKQKSVAIPKLTMGLFYVNPYSYLSLDGNNRRYLEEYGVSTKNFQKMKYADYIVLLEKVKEKMEKKEIAEQTFPEFSANAYSLEGMGDDDGTDESYYQEIAELLRFKKNIIIEGAPGVGKTYELPRIITRLCFPELCSIPNAVLSTKFQQLKDNHQVEYVTFHQSMDYEEFVEGIRPQTDDDGNVIYKTEDGIFKQMCEEAMKPIVEENKLNIRGDATVWKVSLAGTGDNPVRTDCMKKGHIRIGWDSLGEDLSQVQESRYEGKIILDAFYDKMNIGDIVFSCYSSRTIDAIGVIVGDVEWHDEYEHYKRLRKVEWLLKGINENIYDLNGQTSMTLGTVYRLNNITLDKVFGILNSYGVSNPTEAKKNNRPYVLVIDEINRGNVSKIFGELITLIEPDKRAGKVSEIKVRLPYSKKPFVVPDNLYIIGTMNTADRSLDTLDYAMRRRFAFVKFKPTVINVEGFNEELFAMVSKLFISNYDEYCENADVILLPSEYLADDIQPSDVWIGHSYFLMYDEEGNDKTQLRIQYEIIPILEEYIKDGVFKDITEVNNVMEALINYTDAT